MPSIPLHPFGPYQKDITATTLSYTDFGINAYHPASMILHKSMTVTGHTKTKEYILKLMDKVVEVGEENIFQAITGNEASCKATGELLMAKREQLDVVQLPDPSVYIQPGPYHPLWLIILPP